MSLDNLNTGITGGAEGISYPPSHSAIRNPVNDPAKKERATANLQGHTKAARNFNNTGGVIEARPGIIESTHIDPLRELDTSETDQGEDVGITSTGPGPWSGVVKSAMDFGATTSVMLTGGAKMAYGSVTGNEEAFKAGKEAVYGKGS